MTDEDRGIAQPTPGARLPAATRPGRVRLQVADLERSIVYYGRVLGLRVLSRGEGRAALGAGETGAAEAAGAAEADEDATRSASLVELIERPGAARAPRQGRLGLFHFAVLLPDRTSLGAFVRHLAAMGEPAGSSDHLVSEALYLQDPDGLAIEVYADRPRAEWRERDGQIVMTTEPLDTGALVRAAADARWRGMPAGARIGHVHLRVGELEAASAFYHDALGLDRVVWSYPGALFLSAGGYHHHLGVNTWAANAAAAGADEARLLEWELLLPTPSDVVAASGRLESAGHEVHRSGKGVVVRDPWGTALRLAARHLRPLV